MAAGSKFFALILVFFCIASLNLYSQSSIENRKQQDEYSTIVLFRTFDIFSWDRGYKLYAGDSLLGRINTHDVIVIETHDTGITFRATTKAPSLNAPRRANYLKRKKIVYPITLKPGQVYFVKCGYLAQNLFDLPRQPTIKLLKPDEVKKYLKKRFLRQKIRKYLYDDWLTVKGISVE
jgi:hypothetical protein